MVKVVVWGSLKPHTGGRAEIELDAAMKNDKGKWAIYPDGSQEILIGHTAQVTIEHKEGKPRTDGKPPAVFANPTFDGYAPIGGWPEKGEKAGAASGGGKPAAQQQVDYGDVPF